MKEISQYLFIAKLICKERITGLDDSERRQLDLWRNESKEGERVFLNLQKISTEELEKRYDGVDIKAPVPHPTPDYGTKCPEPF